MNECALDTGESMSPQEKTPAVESGEVASLPPEVIASVRAYFSYYPNTRAVVLPALHLIQQALGYVPKSAVLELANVLGIPASEIEDTLSFYQFFKQDRPLGKYRIWVCRSLSCALCGGENLLDYLRERLNIEPGETTADGRFTLEAAECLGACDYAPAVLINETLYPTMTRERLESVLDELSKQDTNGQE